MNYEHLPGMELSKVFCDSCHMYPEPEMLTQNAWEQVLPHMGHFMGIVESGTDPYEGKGLQEGMYLEVAGVFPSEPALSDTSWQRLKNYFLDSAPDSLVVPDTEPLPENKLFRAALVPTDLGGFPAVCMLDFDEYNHRLYVGDVNGYVTELSPEFETTNFTKLINPVVKSIRRHQIDELLLLDIGYLDPKDMPAGAVVMTDISGFAKRALIFEELSRPVDFLSEDFTGNGLEDILVCGFGNLIGSITLHKNTGTSFEKMVLSDRPGAIKAVSVDLDQDADLDVVTLFGQGDEGVRAYLNEDGHFVERTLVEFPPVYGSTDFVFKDIDGDGDPDLVVSCGDNGNYSQILKPYHGIRVFLNQGDLQFEESSFYPMYGAYKLRVEDFDGDGDQDIFSCAFYPDFNNGLKNSLVFLENQGDLTFTASGFDLADEGRWMVMDSGDLDDDGDLDIVIGAYALGPGDIPADVQEKWHRSTNHLLFLENKTK